LTLQSNKKQKIDTCWDNEAKQKRNSTKVQACQATRLFLDLRRNSHLYHMSQRRTNQFSSFHHSIMIQQSAAIQESLKSLNFITEQKVQ